MCWASWMFDMVSLFERVGVGVTSDTPIDQVAGDVIPPGDAAVLARMYVERFAVSGLYLADLDAIEGLTSHDALTRSIASIGVPLWVDAGIASVDDACRALDTGATRVIVGLRSRPSTRSNRSARKLVPTASHSAWTCGTDNRSRARRSWRGNHQKGLWREPPTPVPTR